MMNSATTHAKIGLSIKNLAIAEPLDYFLSAWSAGLASAAACGAGAAAPAGFWAPARSEEHTSELQSQSNLVCRLLLEKKKKNQERLMSSTIIEKTHTQSTKPKMETALD